MAKNEFVDKDKSILAMCIQCEKIIGLISMTNNNKANWEDVKHKSDADVFITVCKCCTAIVDNDSKGIGNFVTKKDIGIAKLINKVSTCIIGNINIMGSNKRVPIMNRYNIFDMAPHKYLMVVITGNNKWPTERLIPGDFM